MMGGFIIGVLAGALAMWKYGDQIREVVGDTTKSLRHKAADGLLTAAETVDAATSGSQGRSASSPSGGRNVS